MIVLHFFFRFLGLLSVFWKKKTQKEKINDLEKYAPDYVEKNKNRNKFNYKEKNENEYIRAIFFNYDRSFWYSNEFDDYVIDEKTEEAFSKFF